MAFGISPIQVPNWTRSDIISRKITPINIRKTAPKTIISKKTAGAIRYGPTLLNAGAKTRSNSEGAAGAARRFADRFARTNDAHYHARLGEVRANAWLLRPALDFVNVLLIVALVAAIGTQNFQGVEVGLLYAFIAYVARVGGRETAWTTNTDIFLVPTDGKSRTLNITADNKAYDFDPSFSPDGKTIAILQMKRPGFEADRQRVSLYDVATKKLRVVTESWDRSAAPTPTVSTPTPSTTI